MVRPIGGEKQKHSMNMLQEAAYFKLRFNEVPSAHTPNWIHVELKHPGLTDGRLVAIYDFKLDEARKAFGALCHGIYTRGDGQWVITTRTAN
jgi:hypothetical protein